MHKLVVVREREREKMTDKYNATDFKRYKVDDVERKRVV